MEMIRERMVANATAKIGVVRVMLITSFVAVMYPKRGFSVSELANKEGW